METDNIGSQPNRGQVAGFMEQANREGHDDVCAGSTLLSLISRRHSLWVLGGNALKVFWDV